MNFVLPLLNAAPGAISQGLLWGIMAIGVYLTFRILNVSDLTVDGSLATGGAVCVVLMRAGCGVATLSIDYYDLGYTTGKMAAKILKGEADIASMPVEFAPKVTKMYNEANCAALGVNIPEDYQPIG